MTSVFKAFLCLMAMGTMSLTVGIILGYMLGLNSEKNKTEAEK